ncbi:MAG: hypothetical protein ACFFBC_04150 [Promethearchaeota archaeon]
MVQIHGFCDEQFKVVKEAFAKNFEGKLEVGASFAATLNGKFIIDVWAGYRDTAQTKPWAKVSIAYVMNKVVSTFTGDPRSTKPIEAFYNAL